jgi:UDPglucose--hexose-1-phosphate uridylyltransferase
MPQLRQDRFTKEWVFVANQGESATLLELLSEKLQPPRPHFAESCPLCPRSTSGLPEISSAHYSENSHFSNMRVLLQPHPASQRDANQEIFRQELIVETSDHSVNSSLLPEAHYLSLFKIAKVRYHELALDPQVKQIVLEKNQCSGNVLQEHAHGRLHCCGGISPELDARLRIAREQLAATGKCIFCASREKESHTGSRISANRRFVTAAPFASLSPFSTVIYPRRHMASFTELEDSELADLAGSVREIFVMFHVGLNDPDFTCRLDTAFAPNKYYHWSFTITPKLCSEGAGWNNKLRMNPVLPERAAEFLRAIRVEQAITA